jgi:hypothetical protein
MLAGYAAGMDKYGVKTKLMKHTGGVLGIEPSGKGTISKGMN